MTNLQPTVRTVKGATMSTKVVQITNIAPQATKDRLESLFGCIGKIDEIRLYPTVRDVTCPVQSRVCYVKFFESSCVAVAQHLTNTVFIDRALIVCPVSLGAIPDEFKALEIISNESGLPGLPLSDSKLPSEVVNRVDGMHPFQVSYLFCFSYSFINVWIDGEIISIDFSTGDQNYGPEDRGT